MTSIVQDIIGELNESHAIIMLGGKFAILNEEISPIDGQPTVSFSSINDFHNRYSNRFVEDSKGKRLPITKIWLSSSDRRQYRGVVFAPSEEVPEHYNLWRRFAVEPERGDWSLMQNHIFQVICNEDNAAYDYMLNWMANVVQNPGGPRSGVCPTLRGGLGVGKGIFARNFGLIFGQHFKHLIQSGQLTGRFNSVLKDALLVFGDEITWGGDIQAAGVLKGLITEPTIPIELKGKDIFTVKNHVNLILASNSGWVVPAGLNERRFFILDVSGARVRDHEYFECLANQMDNGGREAMLFYLLERNISEVNLREYPRNEALTDQIIRSLNSAQRYWYEVYLQMSSFPEYIQVSQFHGDYISYCREHGIRHRMNDSQLGKELRQLCPSIQRRRRGPREHREWRLYLPDIQTARAEFERTVNSPINWGENDEDEDDSGDDEGGREAPQHLRALI